nr:hypothetical protein GCM10020092_072620 [Actinoplanes digitatis]
MVDSADAEIRVTFQGAENSSALGVTALDQRDYAPGAPTMILAEVPWATPGRVDRLARHEFGHAIGLVHEHSSPAAGIRWNKPVVYQALADPPNYWKPEVVDSNVFHRYAAGATQFTSFDPDSVMIYGFPPSWTLDGLTYPENSELSAMDKKFARRIYP